MLKSAKRVIAVAAVNVVACWVTLVAGPPSVFLQVLAGCSLSFSVGTIVVVLAAEHCDGRL